MIYTPASIVPLSIEITLSGAPYSPPGLSLHLAHTRAINGDRPVVSIFVYGVDVELVEDSTGFFHLDFTGELGVWKWFYVATGTPNGTLKSDVQTILVRKEDAFA